MTVRIRGTFLEFSPVSEHARPLRKAWSLDSFPRECCTEEPGASGVLFRKKDNPQIRKEHCKFATAPPKMEYEEEKATAEATVKAMAGKKDKDDLVTPACTDNLP